MTVLMGGLLTVIIVVLGTFQQALTTATAARAQAQTAADSAALAAIAESGPYGHGDPSGAAAHFAEANGAEVVTCRCPHGALSVQVVVRIDRQLAVARAAFDPTRLGPANVGPVGGLDPRLSTAVERLVEATGGRVRVVSGYRSTARQTQLWNQALARYGSAEAADDWVAPPGGSKHERGLAVDLGGDLALAARMVYQLGLPLVRPLPHEPWHFELTGSAGG